MESNLVEIIENKLANSTLALSKFFHDSSSQVGTRYFWIDDLFPLEQALTICEKFPSEKQMRLMHSFREKKFTTKSFDECDKLIYEVATSFQDRRVINLIEAITGISDQVGDPSFYAGGLSLMNAGHFLGPHLDNSHNAPRTHYRTLNLLYYVSPDWCLANGGNLELWDQEVRNCVTVESKFNRLVVMETTPTSWHSVSKVRCIDSRKCISNYYFSEISPSGVDYFNVTKFSAPTANPFLRSLCWLDGMARNLIRKVHADGIGKRDLFDGFKN